MTDLLTTRQVQERLKVDRITIYRMLQDGRLKGIKIGQQWRFPEPEIDRFLSGGVSAEAETAPAGGPRMFPTHCVQTVQNLLVEIGQLGAVVVDLNGEPLTEVTPACAFCRLLLDNPETRQACQASWREGVQNGAGAFSCHAGLQYQSAPVQDDGEVTAYILVGQAYIQPVNEHDVNNAIQKLIARYNINVRTLIEAAGQIPHISNEQMHTIQNWPARAGAAIEAILRERSGFIDRLQRIAQMSRMDLK